jgi:predicted transcriptional regulator
MGTTIQLDKRVRDKLKELKLYPGESYNKVVERLISIKTDEGDLSEETIKEIEQSLEDIKAGRTLSMKEVKQRLKINK